MSAGYVRWEISACIFLCEVNIQWSTVYTFSKDHFIPEKYLIESSLQHVGSKSEAVSNNKILMLHFYEVNYFLLAKLKKLKLVEFK